MGKSKKKKPFIDKKNASTYHLMHRSQRDVAGDIAMMMDADDPESSMVAPPISSTGMVLWPGDNNLDETNQKVMFAVSTASSNRNSSYNNDIDNQHDSAQSFPSSKHNTVLQSKSLKEWRAKLESAGLIESENERADRFLKPISGTGTFLDARSGKTVDLDSKKRLAVVPTTFDVQDALMEVERVFDSIPLTADCMDPDIAAALFGDDDVVDEFEELNDDFVFMAAQEPQDDPHEADPSIDTNASGFDFDEHIRRLLEQSKRNTDDNISGSETSAYRHHPGQHDVHYFAKLKPLHENRSQNDDEDNSDDEDNEDNEDDDQIKDPWNRQRNHQHNPNGRQYCDAGDIDNNDYDHMTTFTTSSITVSKLTPDEERALCEKIEQTLAEYDDDSSQDEYNINEQYGMNDDATNNQRIHHISTDRSLERESYFESAIDEYLQEKKDEVYIYGMARSDRHRKGGSTFSVLMNQKLVPGNDWTNSDTQPQTGVRDSMVNGDESQQHLQPPVDVVLAMAQQRLMEPPVRPPEEDVLFDGKSYYSERPRNPWDCESILTTYSNLDNNPTTIGVDGSRRRRRLRQQQRHLNPQNINNDIQPQQPPVHQPIQLSNRTGLPKGVLYSTYKHQQRSTPSSGDHINKVDNDTFDDKSHGGGGGEGDQMESSVQSSLWLFQKRDKNETAEEKRARKLLIKHDRCMSRIQKKVTREVYETEFNKKRSNVSVDDIAGKTVFRYS